AELGGSDSCIVCEDADINSIIDTIYHNRFDNAGQSCNAIKRLIVHKLRFEEVVEKLRVILDRTKIGPALDPEVEIGPLVSRRQLDLIESQVQEAIDQGAQIASGGRRPENLQGGYYLPTLLTDVRTDMRVWREETFGPVLPIVSFSTEQEAIALANDTQYGLGAWVMTEDHDRFRRISRRLQSGMVTENNVNYLSSQNPFGGYKKSGMGRTHGEFGFHEVTQVKLVSSRQ
ncbi:MAG: aldehyde dehydrogenase family protein, partial [Candidatus Dormibacteraceae bacterium]